MDSDDDEDAALLALVRARPRGAVVAVADLDESSSCDGNVQDEHESVLARNCRRAQSYSGVSVEEEVADSDAETISPPQSRHVSPQNREAHPQDFDSDADTVSPHCSLRSNPYEHARIGNAPGDVEIVTLQPRANAQLENGLSEEDSAEESSEANLYPRCGKNAQVSNQMAEDVMLSSLNPAARKKQPPYGVLPARINQYIHSFQRDGITFLYRLYERGRGGLLADAMGLGKTVQMICFLGSAFAVWDRKQSESIPSARVLIVCPASVAENWSREFQHWTPFRVCVFASTKAADVRAAIKGNEIDVVIVGEALLRNDFSHRGSGLFGNVKWHIVVVDEIQMAKNKNTSLFRAVENLSADCKYGMTGTAVQNQLKELWTIMQLLTGNSGLWPPRGTFRQLFEMPVVAGAKADATKYQRDRAMQATARLRALLEKHIMRRPKSVIQDQIPGKSDNTVLMRMRENSLQGRMWKKFINSYDAFMCRSANQSCDCGSGLLSKVCCHEHPQSEIQRQHAPIWRLSHRSGAPCARCPGCLNFRVMFVGLQIARHALLLVPDRSDEKVDDEQFRDRLGLANYYSDGEINARTRTAVLENELGMSCKLDCALELIQAFRTEKHKTIVFYENLRLGAILKRWATYKGLKYQCLDGSVDRCERQVIVDAFQNDISCSLFFVSKKAGGVGLNITSADRVLIFEPCWNPTLDLQAQDRAHRLGQTRTVKVFRLVVQDSIEDYQFRTALAKQQLSNMVLDNSAETWYFKGKELGNMHAMLRIGNVYQDQARGGGHGFKVVETNGMRDAAVSGQGCGDCHKNEDGFIQQHDMLLQIASTDVDLSPTELDFGTSARTAHDECLGSKREESRADHLDGRQCMTPTAVLDADSVTLLPGSSNLRAACVDAQCGKRRIMSETQEEDALFLEMNADARLVISSTIPKHSHNKQLTSIDRVASGGLNAAGADLVDYDVSQANERVLHEENNLSSDHRQKSRDASKRAKQMSKSARRPREASPDGLSARNTEDYEARNKSNTSFVRADGQIGGDNQRMAAVRSREPMADVERVEREKTRAAIRADSPPKKARSAFSARARVR